MIREIKVRVSCSDADYGFKLNHAIRFLEDKAQVKISVMFRGREITHPNLGKNLLFRFAEDLENYGKTELSPILEGNQMFLTFMPHPSSRPE